MLWAERNDRLFITVEVTDSKEPAVNVTDEGVLTVSTTGGAEGARYEVKLELLHPVDSKARAGLSLAAWRAAARVTRALAPGLTPGRCRGARRSARWR